MKADLYVQGHFWATIDLPADSLLALMAQGMISHAKQRAAKLEAELNSIDSVRCTVSLNFREAATFPTPDNP